MVTFAGIIEARGLNGEEECAYFVEDLNENNKNEEQDIKNI